MSAYFAQLAEREPDWVEARVVVEAMCWDLRRWTRRTRLGIAAAQPPTLVTHQG